MRTSRPSPRPCWNGVARRVVVPTALYEDGAAFAFWLAHSGYEPVCKVVTRSTFEGLTLVEVGIVLA
jgi:hypothetical protein